MLLKLNKPLFSSIQSFNSIPIITKKQDYMISFVQSASSYQHSINQKHFINKFNNNHHFYLNNNQTFSKKCNTQLMRCHCSKMIKEDPEFFLEMSESETMKQASTTEINPEYEFSKDKELNEDPEKVADNAWGDEKLYSAPNKITLKDIPKVIYLLILKMKCNSEYKELINI